ncbi:hypothetical protein OESDEN_02204 [Oesophagostomum dentatum]|uniref:Uncharacterized protein n=1 Tax=Oesophagostomum dentatum TaxID=61180 RepID=A0A0B1TQY5_OESDE|nr:hypothetical protein OESDEN_02204 [Oesophagostomum dentatum]
MIILTPRNADSLRISNVILERMPGNEVTYTSLDSIVAENPSDMLDIPTEFLNKMIPSGFPPHKLRIKIGCIIMLLRNLDLKKGLCNGTKLMVVQTRDRILALHQAGHSIHFIASQLERSGHVVSNFLNDHGSYGQRTSPERPHVISKCEERQILREVSNTIISVGQNRANLNLAASRTTVCRVINASPNIQREAMRKAPRLTARHKALRLRFASENIERDWTKEYQNVLENQLLPFLEERRTEAFVFQQDNATIHVSNAAKSWLWRYNINTLDWPASVLFCYIASKDDTCLFRRTHSNAPAVRLGILNGASALGFQHLLNERTLNPKEIVLLGYSIGCFASVHLACSINEPPAGVILQAPPTSLLRVLLWKRACFEKPFKEHSCCADRFSIYEQICHVRVPVLVIHGEDDRTVPIIHGKAICERAVNRRMIKGY